MNADKPTLYPEMNANIVGILRTSDSPASHYAAALIESLQTQLAEVTQTRDDYATAASVISLWLKEFCDNSPTYDQMIADAARKAANALSKSRERERAAVEDCERAEHYAEEANNTLNQIHSDSNMDYGDYSRLFDVISEIVNWQSDAVWCGPAGKSQG